MLDNFYEPEEYDYEEYEEFEEEYEEENFVADVKANYDILSRKLGTKTLVVEFNYHEATPLQYVIDELSNYIEDNQLDFSSIFSMHTEADVNGDNLLIVGFEV